MITQGHWQVHRDREAAACRLTSGSAGASNGTSTSFLKRKSRLPLIVKPAGCPMQRINQSCIWSQPL